MRIVHPLAWAACALVASLAVLSGAAKAEDQAIVMKVSVPTINDTLHHYAQIFAAAVEKDSHGRIKGEVYPASQLGSIPRQIEGVQFGSIQAVALPPEFCVGIDERFEVLTAPALVSSMRQAEAVAADPAVQKLMLGLGANKGLHGVGLFIATPSSIVSREPIRHLADFKGKKIRVFTSDFQKVSLERLGATPVAMTLGDVLPAIQQGAIDGALAGMPVYTTMHYVDAAKYVTETGQPFIFLIAEVSQKWYASLPKDLQAIIDKDGAAMARQNYKFAVDFLKKATKDWVTEGGELISLPPDEQSAMMETLASVGQDISKPKPQLAAAYKIVTDSARMHATR